MQAVAQHADQDAAGHAGRVGQGDHEGAGKKRGRWSGGSGRGIGVRCPFAASRRTGVSKRTMKAAVGRLSLAVGCEGGGSRGGGRWGRAGWSDR